jgi:excisionase family DNA binding protein
VKLFTAIELAETLQVPVATVYRWNYLHSGPPAIRVGRHVRYLEEDVLAWLEEHRGEEAAK